MYSHSVAGIWQGDGICWLILCFHFSVCIQYVITGWERTVHVFRYPALYSGRIFVPLCRELIIFVF